MQTTDFTYDFLGYKFKQDRKYDAKKLDEYDGFLGRGWKTRPIPRVENEEDAEGHSIHTVTTYDNLDRVVKSQQFVAGNQSMTLIAQTEQHYDSRGQVWKSEQSVVNPENGNVQGKIATFNWFDDKGRQTKSQSTAENIHHVWEYDSLGRTAAQKSMLGNSTLQSTETVYDNSGNAVLTVDGEKRADSSQMRFRYVAAWFDPMGRQLATADFGYVDGQCEPVRNYIPASNETVLVTKTLYDPRSGKAIGSIDPAGRESRIETDALGRVVRSVANVAIGGTSADENVTVETSYTPDGQVATLTAINSTTGNQTTTYAYDGLGRLVREIYPDSENSVNDSIEYGYNRQNEVVTKRDQNGTVHEYQYDNLGRLLADNVRTLGNGVDGYVRKIETAYAKSGNVVSITSFDSNDNVVNQILYQYDQSGQLKREYTSHSGTVDIGSTPFIEHGYDTIMNGLKPISLTYPSGKEISYGYDFAGRVTTISDGIVQTDSGSGGSYGSSGSSGLPPVVEGDIIVRYSYQGLGSILKTEYVKSGLTLDYTASGALDRFGRITDHAWKDCGNNDIVRIKHDYDLAGNRLNRQDMMNPNWSETYAYDGMDQIKSMQRSGHSESWNYDQTGNWMSYNINNNVQNRQHNKANEIQSMVSHDRNGNTTQMPSPKDGQAMNCVYDAWNRLVKINDIIRYEYDGLNHRIAKTIDGVKTLSFFNSDWQELESRCNDVTTTFLWGLRYIDDLIYRNKNEERLYSLADSNWNVIATTDETGEIQERFVYDAFGKVNGLTSDWNRTFTGQVLDQETGLMLYRNRFYHVDLGRFLHRDPIGYNADDENLYRYVENRSPLFTDPTGELAGYLISALALAMVACAKPQADAAHERFGDSGDKFKHCWTSCRIAKSCGYAIAQIAGLSKEARDSVYRIIGKTEGGTGDWLDSFLDLNANQACIGWESSALGLPGSWIGAAIRESCEKCCCKNVGYDN